MKNTLPLIVRLVILCSFLSSCALSVSSTRGTDWDNGDVSSLKRGVTSSDWLLRTVGDGTVVDYWVDEY